MGRWVWWMVVTMGCLGASSARASNHLIALNEVLGSWQGDVTVQFVELQTLAAGQTQLSNAGGARGTTELVFDDATGEAGSRRVFVFTRDLLNGQTGARILVGTQALATLTGVTPDFILPPGFLSPVAGRVCYRVNPPQEANANIGVIDCVAYGKFVGETGRFGRPTPITPDNRALQRVDRTGLTVADWAGTLTPTPQNNAGQGVELVTLCGNGAVNQGEECDGSALGGRTCADLGFSRGTLACRQCHLDSSQCSFCGNDAINGSEPCDGTDLGGHTCAALGFTGGTLACTDTCRLSTADCDPTYFVPGGGPRAPECLAAWQITNAAGRPGADGKAPVRQRCKDGDVGCDADAVAGTCTFTLAVCFDRDDARLANGTRACRREPIEGWSLLAPSAGDATTALVTAVGAVGPSSVSGTTVTFAPALTATERCTASVSATVATRGRRPGTLVLKARTTAAGGRPRDVDTLKLVCQP